MSTHFNTLVAIKTFFDHNKYDILIQVLLCFGVVLSLGLVKKFCDLSEEISVILEREGIVVRPYAMEALPYFSLLSEADQSIVVDTLQEYIKICHEVYAIGGNLKDALVFTKAALQHFGFQYDISALSKIKDEYMTVIYSTGNLQLFRTLSFFEYSSYTIEDIYSRPWNHLYERDPAVTERLMGLLIPMHQGSQETLYPQV